MKKVLIWEDFNVKPFAVVITKVTLPHQVFQVWFPAMLKELRQPGRHEWRPGNYNYLHLNGLFKSFSFQATIFPTQRNDNLYFGLSIISKIVDLFCQYLQKSRFHWKTDKKFSTSKDRLNVFRIFCLSNETDIENYRNLTLLKRNNPFYVTMISLPVSVLLLM